MNQLYPVRVRTLTQIRCFGSWLNLPAPDPTWKTRTLTIAEVCCPCGSLTFGSENPAEVIAWLESHEFGYIN